MRTLLWSTAPWLLGLATCVSASAQTETQTRERGRADQGGDRQAGKQETIRGVIAGVTVAGEMAINYRTNRAEAVEMTYLTVIGSPVHGKMHGQGSTATTGEDRREGRENAAARSGEERERGRGGRSGRANRHRHNVYVVWLTPNTKVCEANLPGQGQVNTRNNEQESAQKSNELNWEELEVGDPVEVTFTRREGSDTTGGGNLGVSHEGTPGARKHGRHRTYMGTATSISILPESESHHGGAGSGQGQGSRSGSDQGAGSDRGSGGGQDSGSNRDRSRDQ